MIKKPSLLDRYRTDTVKREVAASISKSALKAAVRAVFLQTLALGFGLGVAATCLAVVFLG
jgi:hypothetical protein